MAEYKGRYKAQRKDREDIQRFNSTFSKYIRARDGHRCGLCGSNTTLTNSHLITAECTALRWNEMNCHCQCRSCNIRHEHYPEIYTLWFIKKFGLEAYDELVTTSLMRKVPLPDEEKIEEMHREYAFKLGKLSK